MSNSLCSLRWKYKTGLLKIGLVLILLGGFSSAQAQLDKIRKANAKVKRFESQKRKAQKDLGRLFSQEKREVSQEELLADTIIWEKSRYIPERGMINDYEFAYKFINGDSLKVKFKNDGSLTNIFWDSLSNTYHNRLNKVNALRDSTEVFGWHPYWMKDRYQNYKLNLLSTISYFSYDVNPENGLWNDQEAINDWINTPLIELAHDHEIKVLLTVTNYGKSENETFLGNRDSWKVLIDNLDTLLDARTAQGIDIDFEDVPTARRDDFTDFVKQLDAKFSGDSMITLQVKPYNNREAIDFLGLIDYVDYFILQGFDYSLAKCNGDPGPVSPLLSVNSDCACIVNSFDYMIRQGVPANKIILGMPAYGTSWQVTGRGRGARQSFEKYLTYDDVMTQYASKYEPYYDPLSGSSFFAVDNKNGTTEIVWYESKQSLNRKFSWATEHDLKGVAIWALGYDGGHPGVWNAIAENFAKSPIQEIQPLAYDNGKVYGFMNTLNAHRKEIGISILMLTGFFVLGLFISLLDWRVREAFFGSFAYRAIFSAIIIILLSGGIVLILPKFEPHFLLFLGMIIGGLVVYIVTNRYLSYRDKLP